MRRLVVTLFFTTLFISSVHADKSGSENKLGTLSNADEQLVPTELKVRRRGDGFFSSDILRASYVFNRMELTNPLGFDVSSSTYSSGKPESNELFSRPAWGLSLSFEKRFLRDGHAKRLYSVVIDQEDYDGLRLQNLLVGFGFAHSPINKRDFGVRIGGGLNVGVPRSSSFFDDALHTAYEGWVSFGVQLRYFVIDFTLRERATSAEELDAREAKPRTSIRGLSLGFLF